jgi:ribose transport system permease protein
MQKLIMLTRQGIWILLVAMIALGAALSPAFLTWNNFFSVLRQAAALSFVSIGQTFAVIANCVDLSVGPMISLIQCIAAKTMNGDPRGLFLALILIVITIGVVGLFNGFLVARRKANPFIVTLGTMTILEGITLLYTNEQPVGSIPAPFRLLAEGYIGPVPFPAILVVLFVIGGYFLLGRTRFGRYVLAIGGNESVARLAGIPINSIKTLTYLLSAACAAFTGLFLAARMNIGDPLVGKTFSLDSIAAVVIGGTSIAGGRGSIMGTVGGVLLYSVLNNLMNLTNVSPFYQIVVKGAVIVIAVVFYQLRKDNGIPAPSSLQGLVSKLFSKQA